MMMRKVLIAILALGLSACVQNQTPEKAPGLSPLKAGMWRGTIALNDSTELAFNFKLTENDSLYNFTIYNGKEQVEAKGHLQGDSLKVLMPVFANYLIAKIDSTSLRGMYVNPDAENYRLPFQAEFGDTSRYPETNKPCCDVNEKWAVKLAPNTENEKPAIAYFRQKGGKLTGTFMTETGDYRYLEGVVSGDSMIFSAFDGAHLFFFNARIENGQKLYGNFYSGRSSFKEWMAYRDDDFSLADPDTLTYLKEGFSSIDFAFPDLNGDTVSLSDARFSGKPVVVQIMGSWCPNCMDESRYLKEVYDDYHDEGLQVVGLTFEQARDLPTALERARKMEDDLKLPYPILMAGATRNDKAEEAIPALNHIMSYPTTIYLDRDHKVVKIHTGFSGPGTPVYENFVQENDLLFQKLVQSKS